MSRIRPSRVLLATAFKPFGGYSANPTMNVLRRLDAPAGCSIRRAVLPVDFDAVARMLPSLLQKTRPAAILALGLAADAPAVRLERQAVALWSEPGRPQDPEQRQAGPAVRITRVDVDALALRLCRAGIPSAVSQDAGRYLCNFLYYLLLEWAGRTGVPAVFVHLPPSPALAAAHALKTGRVLPSMEVERMTAAARLVAAHVTARSSSPPPR